MGARFTNQILTQELEKLGIDAGKNQLEQIISQDQSIALNPIFQNEIGLFDLTFSQIILHNSNRPIHHYIIHGGFRKKIL